MELPLRSISNEEMYVISGIFHVTYIHREPISFPVISGIGGSKLTYISIVLVMYVRLDAHK